MRDEELVLALLGRDREVPPFLYGFKEPEDWYDGESFVQPASIDLHVGAVFEPEPTPGRIVKAMRSLGELMRKQDRITTSNGESSRGKRLPYVLKPGRTVVVTTCECLKLPANVAAFGFPPTSISSKAVLMTNPGHVDPGFRGRLRLTLINMGKQDYVVTSGQTVVTLLLIKLRGAAWRPFDKRYPDVHPESPDKDNLERLSPDFLDLSARVRQIATAVATEHGLRLRSYQVLVPIVVIVLTGIVSWLGYSRTVSDLEIQVDSLGGLNGRVDAIVNQISELEDRMNLEGRVTDLERLVDSLRQ